MTIELPPQAWPVHEVQMIWSVDGAPGKSSLAPFIVPAEFRTLYRDLGKTHSGDKRWEAIIEAKIKRTREMGCFVAGTLVHTKEGLKPIEQIKVGDLVLSRHESGEGELCYQPVTRTFQYENREVFHLVWEASRQTSDGKPAWDYGRVAVTGGRPIWVTHFATRSEYATDYERSITPVNAWMTVDELFLQQWNDMFHFTPETIPTHAWVTLADGRAAVIATINTVLQSENPDIGVEFSDVEYWDGNGTTLFFGSGGVQESTTEPTTTLPYADELDYDYTGYDCDSELSAVRRSGGYLPMRRTVYNIEVANMHSYYVGELGLWVHNTSGVDVTKLPSNPTQKKKHKKKGPGSINPHGPHHGRPGE